MSLDMGNLTIPRFSAKMNEVLFQAFQEKVRLGLQETCSIVKYSYIIRIALSMQSK